WAARAADFPSRFGTSRLWVSGFYELTPTQFDLLRNLARAGVDIIASLPFPPGRAGRFATGLARSLAAIGAEAVPADSAPSPSTSLERLRSTLFPAGTPVPPPAGSSPDPSLTLISAPDEEREVFEAARAVLRLFETADIPFDRMAVTFPPGRRAAYEPLIAEIFPRAGIPIDSRRL